MERVYAFTDEYGNFGWDLDKQDVSSIYVITAIIVNEMDLDELRRQAEIFRKKHFQTGEIKSSGIANNHARRKRVLGDLLTMPFSIFAIVIRKDLLLDSIGLRFKTSFYKFVNNIVHKELRKAFKQITVIADEIGSNDYMVSFCKYFSEQQDIPNLLNEADLSFENSGDDVCIQLADLVSGSLGHWYDLKKRTADTPDYYRLLRNKIIRVDDYPKTYNAYILENSAIAEDYDKEIAELCFRQAVRYIEQHDDSDNPEDCARVATVKYLLFRFMNNDMRIYISTHELKNNLVHMEICETIKMSTHFFRSRIIAKLRDDEVILASSQGGRGGYKIPSKRSELFDYVNTSSTIIIPMLARLKKCRDLIMLGTINGLDLFNETEYQSLKKFFDSNT